MAWVTGRIPNLITVIGAVALTFLGLSMLQGRRLAGGVIGGGCCGGGAWGAPLARGGGGQSTVMAKAEKAALAYAGTKFGNARGITAKATDYGCHIGVDVYRNGKVALRLAYRGNGRVEEI